ncbi:hypothetical protein DICPUDRAFT_96265 [Dictyostelium purpureum]|uniref:FYVE-type domain-containing protein n=1 Tax=Dictyostelium purpureum TaxID=5786 RepID=F0Z6U0_DICPU|nr:uncharacterized protein DICPUDRAFT_96265 [Dictyostelium purpureum]EGC40368.1 hypothetical protein DICPUDRAFT_96265 [Dictyostelium purpureum]|eukprot:XP_003283119.1 hypothetical protein DICPUDRAFT_96265 [Dictyostelium purpureum]
MMSNEDKKRGNFINSATANIAAKNEDYNDIDYTDYEEITPESLVRRNRTKEFKDLRNSIQLNKNMVWEKLKPKVKLATINKSNLLNDDISEKSKYVHQCSLCETKFGLIKNKKQICLICKLIVCSDCNYNPIPFKELRIPSNNQIVYTCKNCFSIMDSVSKKEIFEFESKRAMSSSFSQFYEQMDLNMVDLKNKMPKFKDIVNKIPNKNSPLLAQARDLERVISIHIKEFENGVRQLKTLQGSTPKQQQVISNMKHSFALFLQSNLPQFKFTTKQLLEKSYLQPEEPSKPVDNKADNNNIKNINIPSNNNNNNNNNNNSINITTANNVQKSPPLLSSFISSFSNLLKPSQPPAQPLSSTPPIPEFNYEDSIDRSKIISVVPAVCPKRGGAFIAITGENLNKPTITIQIGGMLISPFKQNVNAILILSPSQDEEGEVEIIISDGQYILSEQKLIFTDIVFQTENDISKANDQALNTFQKSTTSPLLNSSGESIDNSKLNKNKNNNNMNGGNNYSNNSNNINGNHNNYDNISIGNNSTHSSPKLNSAGNSNYSSPKFSPRAHHRTDSTGSGHHRSDSTGSNGNIDNILNNHDSIMKNYLGNSKIESYSQIDNYNNSPSDKYSIMESEWGSTGGSIDDITVEMVHPLQSSLRGGTKISVQFKNPVRPYISIKVGGVPVSITERSYDEKKVSFFSPPILTQGRYDIEFQQDSKVLNLENIITYERPLPIDDDNIRVINNRLTSQQFKPSRTLGGNKKF